jgi:DNA-binding NarL/FixJ family response regulator
MELTGRRPEVDRITTLAALPRESALVVVGDPGTGKSTLLDTAASRVTIPVVRVGVNASESHWPLSGVTTLFAALDDPRAAAHAARLVQGSGSVVDGLAAAHEFLDAVRGLALQPTLVLIDDADRMDEESQRFVAFLAGRLAGTALRIVATVRSACADGPLAALPSVRLEPLAVDDALVLAHRLAPSDANEGVLQILASETGGNPRALAEQLQALRPEQLSGVEPLVLPLRPTPVVDLVAQQILGCHPDADIDTLTQLALTPAAELLSPAFDRDALEDLVDDGLVRVRDKHAEIVDPLVRSYLYWRLPARARRAAHAVLAEALSTTDLRAAAWHLSFVDDRMDAVQLLEAARSYAVDGLPALTILLTERALQLGATAETVQSALVGVGEVLLGHRLLPIAGRYLAAIRPFRRLPADVRRLRLQYSVEYLSGSQVHADELLVPFDVRDETEADAFVGLLAMVACFRAEAWELDSARDLLKRTEPLIGTATPHTREVIGAARDLIAAVDGNLPADADLHDGLSSAALGAMSDPSLLLLGHALSLAERYRSARRVFAIVLARATRTAPMWVEGARYLNAENEVRTGNYRQALRAVDVWESGSTLAERLREPSRAIGIAWRHAAEGRHEAAISVIDQALLNRSTGRLWGAVAKLHALRGRITLLDGRLDEAVASLEAADAVGRSVKNPTVLRHLGDLVEAYARAGRMDDARTTTNRLAAEHQARPSRWGSLVLARSLAITADEANRAAAQQRAVDVFDATDSQYERARTLAALAHLGTPDVRDRFAAAAAAAFEAAGYRRVVPQTPVLRVAAMPLTGEVPMSPRTADPGMILTKLTAEERAVAQKVTEGYRNKEIASSLYMSQRTVELRLTQIYRKVGARSRSHLVALLT